VTYDGCIKKDERSENFHTMNERVARELIRAFQHRRRRRGRRFRPGRRGRSLMVIQNKLHVPLVPDDTILRLVDPRRIDKVREVGKDIGFVSDRQSVVLKAGKD